MAETKVTVWDLNDFIEDLKANKDKMGKFEYLNKYANALLAMSELVAAD